MRHTAGPWTLGQDFVVAKEERDLPIAEIPHMMSDTDPLQSEQRANAKLIAAAPELLERLRCLDDYLSAMRDCIREDASFVPDLFDLQAEVEQTRNAVAKAQPS